MHICKEIAMSTRKLKSITTLDATCTLSLVSAAAFAAGGAREHNTAGTMRADTMHSAGTMRAGSAMQSSGMTTRAGTATQATAATKPTAATAQSTRTARSTTGQPNASCEDTPNQPGHSISAPGSAFNPDGVAGTHYAGEQPQNSKNPNSVSQYDVACTRPQH